jgi:hypothetical protein
MFLTRQRKWISTQEIIKMTQAEKLQRVIESASKEHGAWTGVIASKVSYVEGANLLVPVLLEMAEALEKIYKRSTENQMKANGSCAMLSNQALESFNKLLGEG